MIVSRLKSLSQENRNRILFRAREDLRGVTPSIEPIIEDVKTYGDRAVFQYTEKFDKINLDSLKIPEKEIQKAVEKTPVELLDALEKSYSNIKDYHKRQIKDSWFYNREGIELGQIVRPLSAVGCYVPGGRAAYPSTVLMTATPAKVAGVKRIVVATPPGKDGRINSLTLAACSTAGVDEVYSVGGAQAVAALAYGTESIAKVDKIVGPGNIFVTAAKRAVSDEVGIDNPAGPSEVLILSDDTGEPGYLAWDMIAQAEHDPKSTSILVTDSKRLYEEVQREIERAKIHRSEAIKSLEENGVILVADNLEEGIEFTNQFAPEHLQIISKNEKEVLEKIENAGSIFLGNYTPVACGDYASGTNHVLPTSGYARMYSGLNTTDFIKYISVQKLEKESLEKLSKTILYLSEAEGLFAHAESVKKRLK